METADIMAEIDPRLEPVKLLCEGEVCFMSDGGRDLVVMNGLGFLVHAVEKRMDALLCLNHTNPTYPTKLYLAEQVGAGLNWNESAYILGRHWYSFSWRDVKPDLPIIEILAAHLGALNPVKAA